MLLLRQHPNRIKKTLETDGLSVRKDIRVIRAINFLKSNYQTHFSLDKLSKEVAVSKYHLLRLFKKQTGQTPGKYLNKFRIEKATELLRDHSIKIEEIAQRVGFRDTRYFRKLFIFYKKATPSAFRP